jgi:hypothetical protein
MRSAFAGILLWPIAMPGAVAATPSADRINADVRARRPLVAHVLVALCDNRHQGIVPVPARLGNGQNPNENLYWGARYGVRGYFRRLAGWRETKLMARPQAPILDRAVYVREAGGRRIVLIADAWDGASMKETVTAFLEAASGRNVETLVVGDDTLQAGGGAHLVAFVGHDGLMDFAAPTSEPGTPRPARAAIVLACASRPYFADLLQRAQADRLLLTTGLMAPEAYSLEAAIRVWFETQDATRVRDAAAAAYAEHQRCSGKAARRLFATGD